MTTGIITEHFFSCEDLGKASAGQRGFNALDSYLKSLTGSRHAGTCGLRCHKLDEANVKKCPVLQCRVNIYCWDFPVAEKPQMEQKAVQHTYDKHAQRPGHLEQYSDYRLGLGTAQPVPLLLQATR